MHKLQEKPKTQSLFLYFIIGTSKRHAELRWVYEQSKAKWYQTILRLKRHINANPR